MKHPGPSEEPWTQRETELLNSAVERILRAAKHEDMIALLDSGFSIRELLMLSCIQAFGSCLMAEYPLRNTEGRNGFTFYMWLPTLLIICFFAFLWFLSNHLGNQR
jgi:hypothetical protein